MSTQFISKLSNKYSIFLQAVTPEEVQGNLGMTVPNESLGMAQAFGIEFFITMILVLTVFGVCDENRNDIKG